MSTSYEGLSAQDFSQLKSAIDEAAIVAITDKKGVITYVNKKFCAISKYSTEELIGKTHKVINSGFHSKEFFAEMWEKILAGKVWEGEIRNRAKDGTFYWVNTTIVPFFDESGAPERFVSVRYEISERVLAQEQLKVHAKKLEVSNRELQDFASIAAHDLQEPLRKIQAFSDRLVIKSAATLEPQSRDYLDRILSSAQRMQTLINDLLTYSRVTTKAQPSVRVDLNSIIAQVVADLEVRIELCHGKVHWQDLPTVVADPTQMRQLFQNLLSNALKFHRSDVPPIVQITAQKVFLPQFPRGAYQIKVADNGIGFDQKYLDRIFTIFQRLHGRFEYEGTGIGLAVCRKIVDRHGGSLTAESKLELGSTFILTLPIPEIGEGQA